MKIRVSLVKFNLIHFSLMGLNNFANRDKICGIDKKLLHVSVS